MEANIEQAATATATTRQRKRRISPIIGSGSSMIENRERPWRRQHLARPLLSGRNKPRINLDAAQDSKTSAKNLLVVGGTVLTQRPNLNLNQHHNDSDNNPIVKKRELIERRDHDRRRRNQLKFDPTSESHSKSSIRNLSTQATALTATRRRPTTSRNTLNGPTCCHSTLSLSSLVTDRSPISSTSSQNNSNNRRYPTRFGRNNFLVDLDRDSESVANCKSSSSANSPTSPSTSTSASFSPSSSSSSSSSSSTSSSKSVQVIYNDKQRLHYQINNANKPTRRFASSSQQAPISHLRNNNNNQKSLNSNQVKGCAIFHISHDQSATNSQPRFQQEKYLPVNKSSLPSPLRSSISTSSISSSFRSGLAAEVGAAAFSSTSKVSNLRSNACHQRLSINANQRNPNHKSIGNNQTINRETNNFTPTANSNFSNKLTNYTDNLNNNLYNSIGNNLSSSVININDNIQSTTGSCGKRVRVVSVGRQRSLSVSRQLQLQLQPPPSSSPPLARQSLNYYHETINNTNSSSKQAQSHSCQDDHGLAYNTRRRSVALPARPSSPSAPFLANHSKSQHYVSRVAFNRHESSSAGDRTTFGLITSRASAKKSTLPSSITSTASARSSSDAKSAIKTNISAEPNSISNTPRRRRAADEISSSSSSKSSLASSSTWSLTRVQTDPSSPTNEEDNHNHNSSRKSKELASLSPSSSITTTTRVQASSVAADRVVESRDKASYSRPSNKSASISVASSRRPAIKRVAITANSESLNQESGDNHRRGQASSGAERVPVVARINAPRAVVVPLNRRANNCKKDKQTSTQKSIERQQNQLINARSEHHGQPEKHELENLQKVEIKPEYLNASGKDLAPPTIPKVLAKPKAKLKLTATTPINFISKKPQPATPIKTNNGSHNSKACSTISNDNELFNLITATSTEQKAPNTLVNVNDKPSFIDDINNNSDSINSTNCCDTINSDAEEHIFVEQHQKLQTNHHKQHQQNPDENNKIEQSPIKNYQKPSTSLPQQSTSTNQIEISNTDSVTTDTTLTLADKVLLDHQTSDNEERRLAPAQVVTPEDKLFIHEQDQEEEVNKMIITKSPSLSETNCNNDHNKTMGDSNHNNNNNCSHIDRNEDKLSLKVGSATNDTVPGSNRRLSSVTTSSSGLVVTSESQSLNVSINNNLSNNIKCSQPLGLNQKQNISLNELSTTITSLTEDNDCEMTDDDTSKNIFIPIKSESINDSYDIEPKPFARGKFAQVKRCTQKSSMDCFAAKCIKKRRRQNDMRSDILLEIEALKLSYINEFIVKIFEVYETPSEMILVLELAEGGELQRVIDEEERLKESCARQIIGQILNGLTCLHQNDIVHLDIKPQNILLTNPYPNCHVKLCDFGMSRKITKDCEVKEICGTPDYVAPEILHYDPICLTTDMWSLGILAYVLLSGYSPFGGETKTQTFCNITQAPLDFPCELFDTITSDAIDFIRKTIVRNPNTRMTSRQATGHAWLCPR